MGAGGLAWLKTRDGQAEGGVAKFFGDGEINAIRERFEAPDGSIIFFVADSRYICNLVLSHLRLRLARELDLIGPDEDALCWVVSAPAFERDERTGEWTFVHHPFTAPFPEDVDKLESDPGAVRTRSYDLVMNGQEIAGGSIRVSDPGLQTRILEILGFSEEKVEERFGFLMRALRYGPPPHGGIAFGFDRLVMVLKGIDDIRETIAFPKTQRAVCLLTGAPAPVDGAQLRELGIRLDEGD
jgi:aspartyl-tRNA synthetase